MKRFTKEQANRVYDVLVKYTGATEADRNDFVYHHTDAEHTCNEYRFCGHLGFGGKYWSQSNNVTCYQEDMTNERRIIIEITDKKLEKILDID